MYCILMNIDCRTFDTTILDTVTLSNNLLLIKKAQEYFEEFVRTYKSQHDVSGRFVMNRALFVCILNNARTERIELYREGIFQN